MPYSSTQDAHPLAYRLIEILHDTRGEILEVGTGSGRNTRALIAAGYPVIEIGEDVAYTQLPGRGYIGALSTHAYLHGTLAKLRIGFAELARVLVPGAPIAVTLGSINDARFGLGEPYDEVTFAPGDGPEIGIPHAYLDRDGVNDVLRPFRIESCEEHDVDAVVGRWAHADDVVTGKRHWFVVARKR
jgi:hypothetical protein